MQNQEKKSTCMQNTCMSVKCAEEISLVTLRSVKRWSDERHFEILLPKEKTITFSRRKLSKIHKIGNFAHWTITFSQKQGETRTSIVNALLFP